MIGQVFYEDFITYVAISRCDADGANHEKPIDPRNVDLTMKDLGCMSQFYLWEV